jgi:class 3 adenylate cyclase/DNA-binding response OmpR family regulator/predicted ATPase
VRKSVLVVAQQIQLRARIARVLHSAGYSAELAENPKRALELAARKDIQAAIVVQSRDLVGLGQELRDKVPRTILVGHGTDEIVRPGHARQGTDAFPEDALDEQKLLDRLSQPAASPGSKGDEPVPAPVKIADCKLDLAGHTFVDGSGREVQLTRAETALLTAFVDSPRRVLSRDQLRYAVAGRDAEPYDRSVDMLVVRLRRKIEPDPKAPRFILSVPGVGYKFDVRPQSTADGEAPPALEPEPLDQSRRGEAIPAGTPGQGSALPHSEPERRQLTVLSCGLVGSTALAANLDPEDFGGTIRRFQEVCTSVITHWGGAVINFVGDEILASFGYPKGHEVDAERAVHAGLDLVERIREVRSQSGDPLQVRIGIATGLVLIGKNQAAIGEAVVLAARLRDITPPNSVTVTASTRKLLGDMFVYDDSQFNGVLGPVTTYEVTGKQAIEMRFLASQTAKLTEFVGRQHELQQMSTLWERAKAGKGQVALLCGEPGIGKSRVTKTWLNLIADEPHIVIRYQCSPHHTNSAFYPIINQLERAAHFEREDTPDVKLRKLEAVLSQAGAATLADTGLYAALLSIPTDKLDSAPDLTPQRQRALTIAALVRQLRDLALTRPVVIVFADAHWIDSSTLELLSRCIASIKAARVFVLINFRPEFFPPWLDESHVTMLTLNRLVREQTEAIILDVAGSKELPGELREQIASKSDGVPLFAEELTKTVLESGLLQDAGDRYVAVGPLPPLAIPTTLLGSLTARLDRLGEIREIAQIGAAIGREFSYRLLAAIAPVSGRSLQTALAHLAACELIFVRGEPPDSTYIFKHALIQDAAYATMVRRKCQQLHSRIGDALTQGFPETVETQPELMAHHLAQAGLTERAIEYFRKAARHAIERSANAEAIGHLTRALEMLESLPENPERERLALGLEVMLGQAMTADRGYAAPETRKILLRAKTRFDDLTDPSQKFAILYGIWAGHYVGGEGSKQRDAAIEFLAEAERHKDTAALCIAHRMIGTTSLTTGGFATALHHLERARGLYDSAHHPRYRYQYGQDIGAAALCYLSWALWHLGYVDRASEVAAEAMKHAEELSHPHTLVYTICHARAFIDLFTRRCADAPLYAGQVVSLCTENGFSHWINCGRIFEGWAEICRGDVDRGIELLRAGIAAWHKRGARLWLPIFLTLEAEAYAKAGRGDAALVVIEEALAIAKDTGERWAMAEVLRLKARLLQAVAAAETKEIETILVSSLEIARAQQARCWELRAACDLARLWQAQGRGREGLKLVQAIYEQFTEGFDTADLREAKALMQDLKRSVGRKRNECTGETADLQEPKAPTQNLKRSVARRWNECAGKTDKTSRR